MNRTIKFRGKIDSGKWVYGNLQTYEPERCDGAYICEQKPSISYDSYRRHYIRNPETIGQFTGLTDKNGVEIYEGDILGVKGKVVGHIVGGVRGYCYDVIYAKPLSNGEKRWSLYGTIETDYKNNIEVIGNIHDNTELLKNN